MIKVNPPGDLGMICPMIIALMIVRPLMTMPASGVVSLDLLMLFNFVERLNC
ncbi:hypothetical protein ACIBL5_00495 [Streptomyces sp. NPDC050516]|uniref:hypothetical protein n=1 Tax=Streptomyces sp. NPDC050516 TaxID=3365621 RepID=UPI0037908200